MRSTKQLFRPFESLRWLHLPAREPACAVIADVVPVRFADGPKLRITFVGKKRCLLANKTNAQRIANQHGDDFTAWPGRAIWLERSETEYRGEIVNCVRVVEDPPAKPADRF